MAKLSQEGKYEVDTLEPLSWIGPVVANFIKGIVLGLLSAFAGALVDLLVSLVVAMLGGFSWPAFGEWFRGYGLWAAAVGFIVAFAVLVRALRRLHASDPDASARHR